MKLIPESAVRDAMQLASFELINDSISPAIEAASEALSGALETSFEQGTRTETFYIYDMLRLGLGFRAVLALKQGFLTAAPTVKRSGTFESLSSAEDVEATAYTVDREKGSVTLMGVTDHRGQFIQVTYSAGFTADGDDDAMFDQTDVPQWLKTAAALEASAELISLNPDLASTEGVSRDPAKLRASARAITDQHVRYFPSPIRAVA